jgi:hypothetical protein
VKTHKAMSIALANAVLYHNTVSKFCSNHATTDKSAATSAPKMTFNQPICSLITSSLDMGFTVGSMQ